jgi:hypothetical protein
LPFGTVTSPRDRHDRTQWRWQPLHRRYRKAGRLKEFLQFRKCSMPPSEHHRESQVGEFGGRRMVTLDIGSVEIAIARRSIDPAQTDLTITNSRGPFGALGGYNKEVPPPIMVPEGVPPNPARRIDAL